MALKPREVLPDELFTDAGRREVERTRDRLPFTPVSFALAAAALGGFLLAEVDPLVLSTLSLSASGLRAGEWWRLASWLFVHAGVLHVIFDVWAVVAVGRGVEALLGSLRFLQVTAVGALGSAALVLLLDGGRPTIGLSGLTLCWVGVLLPIARSALRTQLIFVLVQVAVYAFFPNFSVASSVGGLLVGLPVGLALRFAPQAFSKVIPVSAFLAGVACVLGAWKGA
jgi:membrane associated rhomboid family serine protease